MEALEGACSALVSGTHEERKAADEYLRQFRQSSSPYDVCFQLLQAPASSVNAKYEALATIRTALLREWSSLQYEWTEGFRTRIFEYSVQNVNQLPPVILKQLVLVIAIMFKRGWLHSQEHSSQQLTTQLDMLLRMSPVEQELALRVSLALVSEFNVMSQTGADLGVPWQYHVDCHCSFEQLVLPQLLVRAMAIVEARTQATPAVLNHTLELLECELSWEYAGNRNTAATMLLRVVSRSTDEDDTSAEGSVFLEPGPQWNTLLVSSSIVQILSQWYVNEWWQMNTNVLHHCQRCLIQLMSLRGDVFTSTQDQAVYIAKLINSLATIAQSISGRIRVAATAASSGGGGVNYAQLLSSAPCIGEALLGLAMMCNRFMSTYSFSDILHVLSENIQNALPMYVTCLDSVSMLTCIITPTALINTSDIETWLAEALDAYLTFIVSHINAIDMMSIPDRRRIPSHISTALNTHCHRIFDVYIHGQLAAARASVTQPNQEDVDEQFKESTHDMGRIIDIGHVGRMNALHAITTLTRLLHERRAAIQHVATDNTATATTTTTTNVTQVQEELYWLMHILCEVLTDPCEGEIPLIPTAVMDVSMAHARGANKHLPDPVAHSADAILEYCQLENALIGQKRRDSVLSPLVAESVMWFLHRWCASYLMPQVAFYNNISPTLWSVVGVGSAEAVQLLNRVVEKVTVNLVYWCEEHDVTFYSCNVLAVIANNASLRPHLNTLPPYLALLQAHMTHDMAMNKLSAPARQKLMRCFCQSAVPVNYAMMTHAERQESNRLFESVVQPVSARITNILSQPTFIKQAHDVAVVHGVQVILDLLIGIAMVNDQDAYQMCVRFVAGYYDTCIKLIEVYHERSPDIVSAVLRLFQCVAQGEIECLDDSLLQTYLKACVRLMDTFAACNERRLQVFAALNQRMHSLQQDRSSNNCNGGSVEALAAELESEFNDQYVDISTMLQLVKQLVDKADDCSGNQVAQVMFHGVKMILPNLNENILIFPDICVGYFELLEELSKRRAREFAVLDIHVRGGIINALKYAIAHHVPKVASCGLQTLTEIIRFQYKADSNGGADGLWAPLMDNVIVFLLDFLVYQRVEVPLINLFADALGPALQWSMKAGRCEAYIGQVVSKISNEGIQNALRTALGELATAAIAVNDNKATQPTNRHNHLTTFRKQLRAALHFIHATLKWK